MRKATLFLLLISFYLIPSNSKAQNKHFNGNWTKLQTTYNFSFDLYLRHLPNNKVSGHFEWKLEKYNSKDVFSISHYKNKVGKTAKEYVKGTFNPKTNEYILDGYKKEDPHQIIGIDKYKLKIDKNGDLGGDTKSGGTWKGRINGKSIKHIPL